MSWRESISIKMDATDDGRVRPGDEDVFGLEPQEAIPLAVAQSYAGAAQL